MELPSLESKSDKELLDMSTAWEAELVWHQAHPGETRYTTLEETMMVLRNVQNEINARHNIARRNTKE